ncbi:hypothetical protein ACQPZJ_15005 [Actinoplanes sp. CA-054009]
MLSDAFLGELPNLRDPVATISWLLDRFATLLGRREAPNIRFTASSRGAELEISVVVLLVDWIRGLSFSQLAGRHLAAAADPARRIEQMVGAVTELFEHHLSWTVGAVVELVNNSLGTWAERAKLGSRS